MSKYLEKIELALKEFNKEDYLNSGESFLDTILGYDFESWAKNMEFTPEKFIQEFAQSNYISSKTKEEDNQLLKEQIDKIHVAKDFDINDIENKSKETGETFDVNAYSIYKKIGFLIVKTQKTGIKKTIFAKLTRIINRRYNRPAVILFCAEQKENNNITLSFVERRPHKKDSSSEVIAQKVSMLYAINCERPHRADLDILGDLMLPQVIQKLPKEDKNVDDIMHSWLTTLSIDKLNNKFYKELFEWFESTLGKVKFPERYIYLESCGGEWKPREEKVQPEEQMIRLITRFMFVWFIKEKQLIPSGLFEKEDVFATGDRGDSPPQTPLLKGRYDGKQDNYYRAVLQNLFFATLNTPIKDKNIRISRGFSKKDNESHRNLNKWRYKDEILNPEYFESVMNRISFINGGLFDCLDGFHGVRDHRSYRLDCFTDKPKQRKELYIPNEIFFAKGEYLGLIAIFNKYKFTVEENTPLDIDVALDPELLGRVFENLLASQNPETKKVARKETGSYYTPRYVVSYMVKESLKAYLSSKNLEINQKQIDNLLDPLAEETDISSSEKEEIVRAISEMKVLDPAVGSGAFPMEVLRSCVELLRKVDGGNKIWPDQQIKNLKEYKIIEQDKNTANKIIDDKARERVQQILAKKEKQIRNDFIKNTDDYTRKLYIIRNSIYGVDIQPIACQIAKLRFFISLAIEQDLAVNKEDSNYGIKPLPNLETNLVCANSLIKLEDIGWIIREGEGIDKIQEELIKNRDNFFNASTRKEKLKLIDEDKELRKRLGNKMCSIVESEASKNSEQYKKRKSYFEAIDKLVSWDIVDQNISADWFDPQWMFGIKEKFSIVIGNPPYIRQEKINKSYDKEVLKAQHAEVYHGQADLYTYFYHQGFTALDSSGTLCFITSNKWLKVRSAAGLRQLIKNDTTIKLLIDFKEKIFTAVVDTSIIMFSKHKRDLDPEFIYQNSIPDEEHPELTIKQSSLSECGFIISTPGIMAIKKKLESCALPIDLWPEFRIHRGITTGCNDAFVIKDIAKEVLCSADPKTKEIVQPLIQGGGVKSYYSKFRQDWLINVHSEYMDMQGTWIKSVKIDNYIAVKKHLEKYKEQLTESKYNRDTIYHLPKSNVSKILLENKIICPGMGPRLTASLDCDKHFLVDNCYFIYCPGYHKYLVALFNSKLMSVYYNLIAAQLGLGNVRHFTPYIKKLPIKKLEKKQMLPFDKLVDNIIKNQIKELPTDKLEDELDELVYKLYKITPKQKALIESEITKMPKGKR